MGARPLQYGDYVVSADGAAYLVRHLWTPADTGVLTAELKPADASGHGGDGPVVDLPVAELRRRPNPGNRLPPIEGMPDDRPRCAFCGRQLRPVVDREYERRGGERSSYTGRVVRRTWRRWSSYRGLFCTLRCALDFACACHRAGYRRTK